MHELTVSGSQQSRSSLATWFQPRLSDKTAVKCNLRAWPGLEKSLLRWLPPRLLAGRLSPLPCGPLPQAAWASSLYGSQHLSERTMQVEKEGSHTCLFMSQPWKLHSHFSRGLPVRSESLSTTTLKGRGDRLHLWKGGGSKNWQTYFKITNVTISYTIFLCCSLARKTFLASRGTKDGARWLKGDVPHPRGV